MTFHPEQHFANRSQVPQELLQPHYGKHVAWSLDGKTIIASGDDDAEVFESLKRLGLEPGKAVFSYVPHPEEIMLGGTFLREEAE